MTRDPLLRAWITLCALSLAGAGSTLAPDHKAVALVILALALLKARLILHHYLGLAAAPRWRRGFDIVVIGFCLVLAALGLSGSLLSV